MDVFRLLIFLNFAAVVLTQAKAPGLRLLSQGNTLLVDKENDFLISPNGTFSSGFYKVGTDAYCFSIWFTESLNKTVVWMANRDRPVNGKRSKLSLHKNGNLVLTDAVGSIVWSTNTYSQGPLQAQLLETGNLILINKGNEFIWESFNFPTDTLLPMQSLVKNTTLVSNRSPGTYLSGFYKFKFDDNNVLNLIYNGPIYSSVYWPSTAVPIFNSGRTPYNSTRVAFFNEKGRFKSSDNWKFNATDFGLGPKRRLTLDYDGIVRLYSLDERTGGWLITWLPGGLDACLVHGLCGPNSICSYNPLTTCSCLFGFDRNDPSDWSKGCSPRFNLSCDPFEMGLIEFPYTDYYGYDLNSYGKGVSFEACRTACLNNCRCLGFVYSFNGEGECFPKSILLNGFQMSTSVRRAYIKVPKGMELEKGRVEKAVLNCSNSEIFLSGDRTGEEHNSKNWSIRYLMIFVGLVAIIEIICIILGWWYVFRKHANEELEKMGYIILAVGFKRFTFAELKKATRNFKYEIGKGGFGTVYKGILDDDRVVAVKRLEGILQGESEFWAEVGIIGKLNHKNLVKMRGFCAEGEHKLLVYEYMENGSLDKFLFKDSSRTLDLEQRCNIALGTAKALAYIHEECLEWVLHCDVKPQNILLDDDLEPKVTDFGMSNLFKENHEAGFSRVRGTRGYVAPEWMRNTTINAKADVYSYGVVLLELLSGKSASGFNLSEAQENEYEYEYNHLVQWAREMIKREGIEGVIDPRIRHECDFEKIGKFVGVALSCVREDRDVRPPMSKVVELLTSYADSNRVEESNF